MRWLLRWCADLLPVPATRLEEGPDDDAVTLVAAGLVVTAISLLAGIGYWVVLPEPSPYKVEFALPGKGCVQPKSDLDESLLIDLDTGRQLACRGVWEQGGDIPPPGEWDPSDVEQVTDLATSLAQRGGSLGAAEQRTIKDRVKQISVAHGYSEQRIGRTRAAIGWAIVACLAVGVLTISVGALLAWRRHY